MLDGTSLARGFRFLPILRTQMDEIIFEMESQDEEKETNSTIQARWVVVDK